jgi:universal stress protein E
MRALTIRSILVATDLQPSSDAAVHSAAGLAARLGAELHVLHALDIPTSGYPGTGTTLDFQRSVHDARRMLRAQIERSLTEGATVTSQHVKIDSPLRAINEWASEVEADLIVLGPHRPRAFRGPILGNTADRVIRSSDVPILVVATLLPLPLRQVVVPIDLSDPARGALDQGLLWSATLGARVAESGAPAVGVRVLHVVPRIYEAYDFPFDRAVVAPQLSKEIEEALDRLGGSEQLEVREEIMWGNAPADEIMRFVETEGADLLVMGTHGYGALGRALIGSITSLVARAAPCPVLLVPPALWSVAEAELSIPIEAELSEPALPGS